MSLPALSACSDPASSDGPDAQGEAASSPDEIGTASTGDTGESRPLASGAEPDRAAEEQAYSESQDRMRSCLDEKGLVVETTTDGGWQVKLPEGDTDGSVTSAAIRECREIAQVPDPVPYTDRELDRLYDLLLAADGCLREQGFDPGPADSREQFVQDYTESQAGGPVVPWSPYVSVQNVEAAQQACPQPENTDL
jgi:hypothetical protein